MVKIGIEVGDYIRTKKYICKVTKIIEQIEQNKQLPLYYCTDLDFVFLKKDVIKFSKNIIDLIEEGDYVNEYKVRGKTSEKVVVDYYCYSEELAGGNWLTFYKDNINVIVTKEQYKSIEYKV